LETRASEFDFLDYTQHYSHVKLIALQVA